MYEQTVREELARWIKLARLKPSHDFWNPRTDSVPSSLNGNQRLLSLHNFRKHAAMDTPAKLSLAGALAGGGLGGAWSLWNTSGLGLTWKDWLRLAGKPALIGAGIGSLAGPAQALAHSWQTAPEHGDSQVGFWRALGMTSDDLEKASPVYAHKQNLNRARRAARGRVKKSSLGGLVTDNSSLISVDNFNRAVWDDVNSGYTTPDNALLVTSTMNASGSGLVTPGAVIGTLVNAGVGYATAGVIGKTLGALNMVSPSGQNKLKEIGIWGGIINGVGNAITR